ncbi:MAG TPA: fibronectin type III domain-containing protein [Candidatus Limnocylindria bacterium]|nr:fibronectin type III domain-containing protein [Candidatus Limnocylindria bacterium]
MGLLAVLIALAGLLAATADVARASSGERLKAVVIVGPTGNLTSQNLTNGEKMARAAEAQGMEVHRVFHPKATWENVLAKIQGANLVVYMGHGNGWPSPYGPFQERTKNGFGLNPFEGSRAADHKYYGADPIRERIQLADNAVVILVHLCYSSGNSEPGMAIPREDIARQRVDNYAAAFLAVGARAVFSSSYYQRLDVIGALHTTDKSMDELFSTPAGGGPAGFIGWRSKRFASERTPGTSNHLDPHSSYGYVRALSGDLSMTAAEWRGGAALAELAPPDVTPPSAPDGLAGESRPYRHVALSWLPSTDDRDGVIRYRVLRKGKRIATVTATEFVDRPSAGWHRYKVRAVDAAGNRSAFSTVIQVQAVKGAF